IQLRETTRLRVTNHVPEEKRHAAETMQRRVRTAVFVEERVLERQGHDARDRMAILARDVDRHAIAQARHKIAKPRDWLGRQSVTPAGHPQQLVKSGEQLL